MKTNDKDTKQGVVPALRFPEFRKNAEWNIPHLSQISTRIITKVGCSKLLPVSISAGVGFVAQTEKFGRDISGEQYQNYIELNRGEFAYNKGNSKKYPQGCIYRLEEFDRVAAPNAFLCFRFDDSVIPDFFKGYFDSNYHGKQLQNVITSGARSNGLLNISADEFFNIILPTPKDKDEQKKIAECLSSIDALIKTTESKIDELKAHKKGLMQLLLPTEGKTVPALRFPEFQESAEWETPHLCQISTRITTKVGCSKLPSVSISAGIGFVAQTEKFGRDISGEQYRNYIELNKGEFAYNKGNSKKYPQGCVYRLKEFEKVAAPNAFICFRFDNSVIPDFFKGYFDSNYHGKQLQNVITSGARSNGLLNISADEFFNIILPTPKDKKEQHKIADCLSSIDDLIMAQTNRLEALKTHKKGLMQQLFPNINDC